MTSPCWLVVNKKVPHAQKGQLFQHSTEVPTMRLGAGSTILLTYKASAAGNPTESFQNAHILKCLPLIYNPTRFFIINGEYDLF